MEKALIYFNSLASIIIIIDSITGFFSMRFLYSLESLTLSQRVSNKYKYHLQKDTYIIYLLGVLSFITLPLLSVFNIINYGFSNASINHLILSIAFIFTIALAYKTSKIPYVLDSFINYTIHHIAYNLLTITILLTLLYPNLKHI